MTGERTARPGYLAVPDDAPKSPAVGVLNGRRFFCSWSGGKDAYLALQRAVAAGGRPAALLTMLHEGGRWSRGHGLPLPLLEAQAAALAVPLMTRSTTWGAYEENFVAALRELRAGGVQAGVFGDIDLQAHRDWVEGACNAAGLACHLPLWREPRRRLLDELLVGGVRATVVAVDAERLDAAFLGRRVDDALIADLLAAGADACGEEGEYHTVVTAAPLFAHSVQLRWDGIEELDGHYVLKHGAPPA